jgi:hypothetical protein
MSEIKRGRPPNLVQCRNGHPREQFGYRNSAGDWRCRECIRLQAKRYYRPAGMLQAQIAALTRERDNVLAEWRQVHDALDGRLLPEGHCETAARIAALTARAEAAEVELELANSYESSESGRADFMAQVAERWKADRDSWRTLVEELRDAITACLGKDDTGEIFYLTRNGMQVIPTQLRRSLKQALARVKEKEAGNG